MVNDGAVIGFTAVAVVIRPAHAGSGSLSVRAKGDPETA